MSTNLETLSDEELVQLTINQSGEQARLDTEFSAECSATKAAAGNVTELVKLLRAHRHRMAEQAVLTAQMQAVDVEFARRQQAATEECLQAACL